MIARGVKCDLTSPASLLSTFTITELLSYFANVNLKLAFDIYSGILNILVHACLCAKHFTVSKLYSFCLIRYHVMITDHNNTNEINGSNRSSSWDSVEL